MKRTILIFGVLVFWTFKAYAEEVPSCGKNCTYTIENGVLTIKPMDETKEASISTYDRYRYSTSTNYAPWRFDTSITKVVIEQGITSIGGHAFEDMLSVTSLELPEGLKTIANEVFHNTSITSVNLPSTLTTIGHYSFSIRTLEYINALPEGLTSLTLESFSNTKIKDLVVPSTVTNINVDTFGFSDVGWNEALIENLYCEESIADQCAAALQWKKNNGASVNVISYQRTDDGRFFYNNKWYDSPNNILADDHIKKRIYTVEEATTVSKPTGNTIKLRYK